ncbi:MAG: hypothetical protein AAB706_01535 [Patescibacteria group bacterium]
MNENEQDQVIVDDVEENNEEVEENAEEKSANADKPKRTPQEEYEYHKGRTDRLAKKLGIKDEKIDTVKNTPLDKPSELDYGQLALLRTEGIKGSGEVALFKEIMTETGKGMLEVLDSNYFKSRLTDYRSAQESANAIPKGKNRSGQTGVTDIDVAIAKYKEDGTLPSDFKTRSAVVKALEAEELSSGMFEGPSVVGPRR